MSDVNMKVSAGACRFVTEIKASSDDYTTVILNITSDCPAVKKLAEALKEMGVMDAVATPIIENPVFIECGKHLSHAACPVPFALVKACEAAGELALKKDVSLEYVKQ